MEEWTMIGWGSILACRERCPEWVPLSDEMRASLCLISRQEWDERVEGDVLFLRFARDVARDLPVGLVEQTAKGAYLAIPDAIDVLAPGVYPVYRQVGGRGLAPLVDDGIPMIFEVPT